MTAGNKPAGISIFAIKEGRSWCGV